MLVLYSKTWKFVILFVLGEEKLNRKNKGYRNNMKIMMNKEIGTPYVHKIRERKKHDYFVYYFSRLLAYI